MHSSEQKIIISACCYALYPAQLRLTYQHIIFDIKNVTAKTAAYCQIAEIDIHWPANKKAGHRPNASQLSIFVTKNSIY
jgi:hypothetical protein